MKKISNVILAIALTVFTLAAQPTKYFSKRIDTGSKLESGFFNQISSDGVFIVSDHFSDKYPKGDGIVKTDFEGNFLWQKSFAGLYVTDFSLLNDTLYLFGNKYYSDGKGDILVHILNTNGDSLNTIYFGTNSIEHKLLVRVIPEGGFFGGYVRTDSLYNAKKDTGIYFRANRTGKVLWQGGVGTGLYKLKVFGFNLTNDGNYFMGVGGIPINSKDDKINAVYTKFKPDGTIIFQKRFPPQNDSLKEEGWGFRPFEHKSGYFGSFNLTCDTNWTLHDYALQMYTLDQDMKLVKKGARFLDRYQTSITKQIELDNGDFVCIG
ncbi:MAG: hypothetical protein ACOYOA_11045 [Saprospiraceae bacterium]